MKGTSVNVRHSSTVASILSKRQCINDKVDRRESSFQPQYFSLNMAQHSFCKIVSSMRFFLLIVLFSIALSFFFIKTSGQTEVNQTSTKRKTNCDRLDFVADAFKDLTNIEDINGLPTFVADGNNNSSAKKIHIRGDTESIKSACILCKMGVNTPSKMCK